MNILDVQDNLKNLSDQQLGQLLQQPNGSAPQYLVMTELQRRKEMRKKVTQDAPRQSMAEEAVSGLAALPVPQGMAPIAERAGVPQQPPPQGMYGGGLVRMAEGGQIERPFFNPQSGGARDLQSLSEREIDLYLRGYRERDPEATPVPSRMFGRRSAPAASSPYAESELRLELARRQPASPRQVDFNEMNNEPAPSPPPATFAPPAAVTPAAPPPDAGVAPAAVDAPATDGGLPLPPPATPTGGITSLRGAGGGGGNGGGVRAALPLPPPPTPTPSEPGAEAASPAESRFAALRRQIEEGRGSSADARREAQNLALIEAGLKIAGSQSPHFAAALGEGAGAVGSYARQVSDIRKGDRENVGTQIALENAETTEAYRRDSVAADRDRTAAQERIAEANNRTQLQAAGMRLGGGGSNRDSMDGAIRNYKAVYGVDYDPSNEDHRRNLFNIVGRQAGSFDNRQDQLNNQIAQNINRELDTIGRQLGNVSLPRSQQESLIQRQQLLTGQLNRIYGIGAPAAGGATQPRVIQFNELGGGR